MAADRADVEMLSGLLHRLGCAAPETASPAALQAHPDAARSLAELDSAFLGPQSEASPAWKRLPTTEDKCPPETVGRARATFDAIFGDFDLFVMKDAAMPWVLPFWRPVLEQAHVTPFSICMIRKPTAVIGQQSGAAASIGHLVWLNCMLEMERNSRGGRRCFVTDALLTSDAVSFVEDTQEVFGLYWPSRSERIERDIVADVAKWKQDHLEVLQTAGDDVFTDSWADEVYAILNAWALRGENAGDLARLDAIYREFKNASVVFEALLKDNDQLSRRAAMLSTCLQDADHIHIKATEYLESQVGELTDKIAKLQSEKQALAEAVREARMDQQALSEGRDELAKRTAALEQQVEALAAEKNQLATDCGEQSKARQSAEAQLVVREQEQGDLKQCITKLEASLAEGRQVQEALLQKQARLDDELAMANKGRAALDDDLAQMRQKHDAIGRENALLQQQHVSLEQERERLQQEAKAIEGKFAQERQAREGLRQDLEALQQQHVSLKQERERLHENAETLESSVAQERQARESLRQELESLQQRHEILQQGRDSLQQEHIWLQQERDWLRSEQERLNHELAEARQETAQRDEQLGAAHAGITEKDRALSAAQDLLGRVEADLATARANHERERETWTGELRSLEEERDRLAQALTAKETILAARQDELATLNTELADRGERLSATSLDLARMTQERLEAAHMLQLMAVERDGFQRERDELAQSRTAMQAAMERNQDLIARLNRELGTSEAGLAERDKDVIRISHKLAETESALRQRQLEADETSRALKDALDTLKDERANASGLRARQEAALQKIRVQQGQIDSLLAENETQTKMRFKEIATLSRFLSAKEGDLAAMAQTLSVKEGDLAVLSQTLSMRQKDLAAARKEIERGRNTSATLSESLNVANREMNHARGEIQALSGKLGAVEGDLHHRSAELAARDERIQALASENELFRQRIAEFARNLSDEKERYNRAVGLMAAVQGDLADQRRATEQIGRTLEEDRQKMMDIHAQANDKFRRAITMLLDKSTGIFPKFSKKWSYKQKRQFLEQSGLFDPEWYLEIYEDVRSEGFNPLDHFLEFGISEGRSPNSAFSNQLFRR